MKKFYGIILGVLNLITATMVQATEKFEVLPDLPDPLAYAVQPVQAASVSGTTDVSTLATQSIGNEPSIISVLLSLVFVILLIYLTGIIYAKLNRVGFKTLKRQQGDFAKSQVAVISTTQLGNSKTLHVVELDGKRMLIGASPSAIQLIKDLGSYSDSSCDDEFSHIEIPNIKIPKIEIPKIEIPSINFSKLVTKTHEPIGSYEKEQTVNKDIESVALDQDVNGVVEENKEVIIDSLFAPQSEPIQEIKDEKVVTEHVVDPDDFALYKKYLS